MEEANDDPLVGTDWTPATNDQEAFKDESRRTRKDEKVVQRASRGQGQAGVRSFIITFDVYVILDSF